MSKYEEWESKKYLDSEVEDLTAKNFYMERIEFIIPAYDRPIIWGALIALQAQNRQNWLAHVVVDNSHGDNYNH